MKNSIKYKLSAAAVTVLVLAGCANWLDVKPNNEQGVYEFWNSKEEVEAVVVGIYTSFRNCIDRITQWGELRGDGVDIGPGQSGNDNWNNIKDLEIRANNNLIKWVSFYTTINRCNAVIKYAPDVLDVDNTFSREACDNLIAEAKWMRALCYFYLVRAFWDVPYVTEPYVDDSMDYAVAKTDGDKILEYIVQDLLSALPHITITYPSEMWQLHGRATIYSAYALLADIYLWQENYEEAAKMCQYIINSEVYSLMPTQNWYRLYYPGNSAESLFEIQWSYAYDQTNSLYGWFYGNPNNNYAASQSVVDLFDSDEEDYGDDVRGVGGSYLANLKIWKYGGTSRGSGNERDSENRDANWIVYRLADVILMRAEALIMIGGDANYAEAHNLIVHIRERAGLEIHPSMPSRESDALDLLLDERLRELCFEGKRWFDLVRVAIRDDARYKNKLINILLKNVAAADRPLYESKLNNVYSYFFPIHEDDIIASGGVLLQNPYYQ